MNTNISRSFRGLLVRAAVIAAPLTAAGALHAAEYTVTYLHPPAYDASWVFGAGGSGGTAQQAGYVMGLSTGSVTHAAVWASSAASVIQLHPAGFADSVATATIGTKQAGYGFETAISGGRNHALLWTGSAASAVDLNPANITDSVAYGLSASQQVGNAFGPATGGSSHAYLWTGTAASAVDLHPTSGFTNSTAQAVAGNQQVGFGEVAPDTGNFHALLWTGTAASFVDLNPAGFLSSQAWGTDGTTQVGGGSSLLQPTFTHALLWSGLASTYVDLNPTGFDSSLAQAVFGNTQVGFGTKATETDPRALAWTGTALSATDLHALLAPNYSSSQAFAIAPDGTIAGTAYNTTTSQYEAILWTPTTPVPEPATLSIGLLSLMLIGRRARTA